MNQRLPFSISYWTGTDAQEVHLRAGTHFRFDLDAVNQFSLFDIPPRLVDLLRIASAIYVVDRLVKRHSSHKPRNPARTLGVKIHVLDDAFWNRRDISDTIGEAVDFVSGDYWDFEFVKDPSEFSRAKQLLSNPNEGQTPLVALYSGGLDSAAGLAARIADNPNRPILSVSVWHQPRQRYLLRKQYSAFRTRLQSQIAPLIVKVAMIWSSELDKNQQERSQRCRSFLFASLGAIAAITTGQQVVELFESGIGAINLPLMSGLVGAKTTRSSHPEFLRLMSRIASLVADHEIEFRLPFFDHTKGEIVKKLSGLNLHDLANMTASCVGFPLRHSKAKQCGVCPACLFRRQAMHVAGITEANDSYKHDIFDPSQDKPIPVDRLKYLKAFLMQVAQLDDVEMNDRLPRAFERHVLGTGILQRGQSQKGVIDLLARYRNEWTVLAAHARRNGQAWAGLLVPQQPQDRLEQGVTYASA